MPFDDDEPGTTMYKDVAHSSPDEKILGGMGTATSIVVLVAIVVIALDSLLY